MAETTMQELAEFGQSVWLDYISRSLIDSGKLQEMIDKGVRGMTSNPSIFDKAISNSADYDEKIKELHQQGKSTFDIYDDLTIMDIQDAADLFRPLYEKTHGLDGYISLEINPKLAYKVKETIEQGKRLHRKVNRPNVMFKVPSTDEGFAAIEALLAEGINVNVTLIFSLNQYINTAKAYMRGLENCLHGGGNVSKVCSVASVFVSRVDTLIDKLIEEKLAGKKNDAVRSKLISLKGRAAVANSAIIYGKYREIFFDAQFESLRKQGANVQRLLWGSTSTKNPAYNDIKYVAELIGKETVNTVPEGTIYAFLDHGKVGEALTGDTKAASKIIDDLMNVDIDINDVCRKLLDDGVVAFEKSFDSLMNAIEKKREKI